MKKKFDPFFFFFGGGGGVPVPLALAQRSVSIGTYREYEMKKLYSFINI